MHVANGAPITACAPIPRACSRCPAAALQDSPSIRRQRGGGGGTVSKGSWMKPVPADRGQSRTTELPLLSSAYAAQVAEL